MQVKSDLASCFAFALSTRDELQLVLVALQRRVGGADRHSKQQHIILLGGSSQAVQLCELVLVVWVQQLYILLCQKGSDLCLFCCAGTLLTLCEASTACLTRNYYQAYLV